MLSGLKLDITLDISGNGIYGFIAEESYCKISFYLGLFLKVGFLPCSLVSVESKERISF